MTKEEVSCLTVDQLGKLASEKILSYHQSREIRNINDLFYILNELARKFMYVKYRSIDPNVTEETIAQVSEDVLMLIYKSPQDYLKYDNFVYYYKSAVEKRALSALKHLYRMTKNIEYSEIADPLATLHPKKYAYAHGQRRLWDIISINPEEFSDRTVPIDKFLEIRDSVLILISTVNRILQHHPLFSDKCKYLTWPLIFSLLRNDDILFSGLRFRERCAIRLIKTQIETIIARKVWNTNG